MADGEVRSSLCGMDGGETAAEGVGGRQKGMPLPTGGGGYPDICKKNARAGDHRLDELKNIGLSSRWLDIAEAIGFDSFMTLWSILDRENLQSGDRGREAVRVRIPQMRLYFRYQRNRLIQTLADNGRTTSQIRLIIMDETGESISLRHIDRIISGIRLRA